MRRFRTFVRVFVRRHFRPIDPTVDLGLEPWLASTTYNEQRKTELRRAYEDVENGISPDFFKNKSHMKPEFYPKYKSPRAINSRTDQAKTFFGPATKEMEKIVYDLELNGHKVFIKHIPVAERAKFIMDHLSHPGNNYYITDHTAFEAHMVPEVISACESQLYGFL